MKKVFIILLMLITLMGGGYALYKNKVFAKIPFLQKNTEILIEPTPTFPSVPISTDGDFQVFSEYSVIGYYHTFDEALAVAKYLPHASIKEKGKYSTIWDNYPPYSVYLDAENFQEFGTLQEAISYAKVQTRSSVYQTKNKALIWDNYEASLPSYFIENVSLTEQYPELPRGCEVTSLTMLINYLGFPVDKLTLADQITKDPTPYQRKDGKIYAGNPNRGFVGNMKSKSDYGLGVYHRPIFALLEQYVPDKAVDLTGTDFDVLYFYIVRNQPVWVIINSTYKPLSPSQFETWHTQDGKIDITYYEHSVLITGYDEHTIYFNDPLNKTSQAPKKEFIQAWEQMGRQAVSATP